jgi:hypothetical protein
MPIILTDHHSTFRWTEGTIFKQDDRYPSKSLPILHNNLLTLLDNYTLCTSTQKYECWKALHFVINRMLDKRTISSLQILLGIDSEVTSRPTPLGLAAIFFCQARHSSNLEGQTPVLISICPPKVFQASIWDQWQISLSLPWKLSWDMRIFYCWAQSLTKRWVGTTVAAGSRQRGLSRVCIPWEGLSQSQRYLMTGGQSATTSLFRRNSLKTSAVFLLWDAPSDEKVDL